MKICNWIILTLICVLGGGCSGEQKSYRELFSTVIYTPEYASGFEILGSEEGESTLLRITRPWQGESVEEFELLILRGAQSAPANFKGAVIPQEAKRIVALSSSNVAMFDRLGQAERIVGVSGLNYISSENITARAEQKKLHDVGYDSSLNYELITALKPDIVLLYGVAGRNTNITEKFDELNIPYIYIGDYAEESPLGKAEWIVAMGEICSLREKAEELFEQSADKYSALRQAAAGSTQRPKVMLNTPYRDIWYMPSSKSYMVQLIADAGGSYIYSGNESSETKPISLEEAYKLATSAEVWINTGATNTMAQLRSQMPKFMDMPMVKRGRVYNNTARSTPMGGSDFWESGVVHPEIVLEDLIRIIQPDLLDDQGDLYYYQKLQ